jgi:Protein of unknown function (DUF3826)
MKKVMLMLAAFSATLSALAVADPPIQTNLPPRQIEANAKAIENRAADIMNALALSDPNKAAGVHDILFAQCQALSVWHNENDPKLKAAKSDTNAVCQIHALLKQLHDQFIAKLSENLTPSQIEIVKDKMTHGVVQVTYNAYLEIVPNLTDADKAKILELLKDDREEAMDAGNSKERAAIIKKYKGKINNYLDAHGHDVAKAYKEWGAKQKSKTTANSTTEQ